MKTENAQQTREACQIGRDDAFKVGHAAELPIIEVLARQQTHANEHINRRYDVAIGEQARDDALHSREHRVSTEIIDRHL